MARHGENIRKRKDGRWEGRYQTFDEERGRMIYRSVYGKSYEEVKEKISRLKFEIINQKVENRVNQHVKKVLFSQAAGEWLDEIEKKRKYSTYVKYNTIYRTHLAGVVGSYHISAAEAPIFQTKISEHLSEKIISESLQKSICCVANQILNFANQKYLTDSRLLEIPSQKSKKKITTIFSRAEQIKLLDCIYKKTDKFKMGVLLCLYAGLRIGELCALQWTDFDFQAMTLTISRTVQRIGVEGYETKTILLEMDPKSESSKRTIPLTIEMAEFWAQLKGEQPYVFEGNKPLDPRTMQYRFKKILKEAGIDYRNFHTLRHTFATNCVENDMDVKALSEILGHSDVKITLNSYVHPTMDSKRKQMGALSDFYGQVCGQPA